MISNCQLLRELHDLSNQIEQRGRPVPWNLIELWFDKISENLECDHMDIIIDKNMVDKLKVKHLEIHGEWNEVECVVLWFMHLC